MLKISKDVRTEESAEVVTVSCLQEDGRVSGKSRKNFRVPADRLIGVYRNIPVNYGRSMDKALVSKKIGKCKACPEINSENFRNVREGKVKLNFYLVTPPSSSDPRTLESLGLADPSWEEVMALCNHYTDYHDAISLYPVSVGNSIYYLGIRYAEILRERTVFVCSNRTVFDPKSTALLGIPKVQLSAIRC